MTAATRPAGSEAVVPDPDAQLAARVARLHRLAEATDGLDRTALLAIGVAQRLELIWRTGGRAGDTAKGRQPTTIRLRRPYVWRAQREDPEPVAARLARNQGLLLRLHLLMLFDVQCRIEQGAESRNRRRIAPRTGDRYASWRELVLTDVRRSARPGRARPPRDTAALRRRQITEAIGSLAGYNLVELPEHDSGRPRYNDFRLASELAHTEAPRYRVPASASGTLGIPREFFTNLWLWVLSDAEIAVYLALLDMRRQRPGRHAQQGVFITSGYREDHYGMHRATWRNAEMLFRLRLIDRMPQTGRTFATGKIGNPAQTPKGAPKPVVRYWVNDAALQANALATALQVLTAPTDADRVRRNHGPLAERAFIEQARPLAQP